MTEARKQEIVRLALALADAQEAWVNWLRDNKVVYHPTAKLFQDRECRRLLTWCKEKEGQLYRAIHFVYPEELKKENDA